MYIMNTKKILALTFALAVILSACFFGIGRSAAAVNASTFKHDYGVFLGYDGALGDLKDYRIVVIDASYRSKKEISDFRKQGHIVYSYLNIGSLERFRSYYDKYKELSLGKYAGWDDEVWVDVSADKWQKLILNKLVPKLKKKNVDGLFIDNCDVYFYNKNDSIFNGLCAILEGIAKYNIPVIINGGDVFINKYNKTMGNPLSIASGINQENIYGAFTVDGRSLTVSSKDSRKYFKKYVEKYAQKGMDIYLLEYTSDEQLSKKIQKYCKNHGFYYYITDRILLDTVIP